MIAEQLTAMIAQPYRRLPRIGYDFSNGLVLAWLCSGPAVQLQYDLETDQGAEDWTFWWISGGRQGCPGIRGAIDRNLLQTLHLDHIQITTSPETPRITPLLSLVYWHRADVRKLIDVSLPAGLDQLWRWWFAYGRNEYFGSEKWLVSAELQAIHRLDISYFRETGIARPTALVMLAATAVVSVGAAGSPALPQPPHGGTAEEIDRLWEWFLTSEARRYGLPRRGLPFIPVAEGPPKAPDQSAKIPMPPDLAIVAICRPDLRRAFGRSEDRSSEIVYWWLTAGREDFEDLREEIDLRLLQLLHLQHFVMEHDEQKKQLTPLLSILWSQRDDLRSAFDVATVEGAAEMWLWWFSIGRNQLFGALAAKLEQNRFDKELPPELVSILRDRPDLQAAFTRNRTGPSDLVQWWRTSGRREFRDLRQVIDRSLLRSLHPVVEDTHAPERDTGAPIGTGAAVSPALSDGSSICLIGYPRGEFGLGEDFRLLRAALKEAKIDNIAIDAPWPITARQSIDEPAIDASSANFDCDIMFYVMPPFDAATLLTKMGPAAFSARRKIGFWQWELDRFPIQANLALHLIDEIWCHSEHTAKAFRSATDKPVIKVPLPVFVPEPRIVPRSSFGLPAEAFVIFTAYDGASAIARKNPLGSILSFQQAFPSNGMDARLIVKAMNTQNDSLWRECRRKALIDERIVIIEEVLDRSVYYELLRNCDAVLSLHRAEGFGRLMAEAMALGIPAIASRYSGNLDFMNDENSWLIEGELIPLLPGDYPFHQGQQWFEPSIADAARALRECAADPADRSRRAASAMHTMKTNYSLETCGNAYAKLLNRNTAIP